LILGSLNSRTKPKPKPVPRGFPPTCQICPLLALCRTRPSVRRLRSSKCWFLVGARLAGHGEHKRATWSVNLFWFSRQESTSSPPPLSRWVKWWILRYQFLPPNVDVSLRVRVEQSMYVYAEGRIVLVLSRHHLPMGASIPKSGISVWIGFPAQPCFDGHTFAAALIQVAWNDTALPSSVAAFSGVGRRDDR